MQLSSQLRTLAKYMVGEFNNREQALSEPAWYVHLQMWQRLIPIFPEDSLTIFAEQANIINLDKPYRQRIMRLVEGHSPDNAPLQVQYYMFKDPTPFIGAGRNPTLLQDLTPEQLELLPSCILNVTGQTLADNRYKFTAIPPVETCCRFTYLGQTIQVSLGFEATEHEFLSYDKGIDPNTGKALWGAMLGPFRYTKQSGTEF
ncbi:chromophore lyase CpcT/CpeT [Iningainema tapete]|uniref:Chromophore lyase CpcT/CpeT n=1 Tax=Iningainema tapete BLCC-T55 TaxID=2748662 RepID=A0A8J6XQG0_9CYAN|nr:chromophore lyase CpcT/CpeT [Iningainema tapete]MBD2776344.1 chromophore lyase CpcT/CpeT [Iningainema tapete BLCC-T55]